MTVRKTFKFGATALLMTAVLAGVLFIQQAAAASVDNTFIFSNTGISTSGSGIGYQVSGTHLEITAPGTYVVTGSSSEGTITVSKELSGVTLMLKNLSLTSTQSAPITISKSSSVTIQVTGSNTLTDNEDPNVEDTSDTYEGAGIKLKSGGTLAFTDSGTLTVNGNCNNGMKGAAEASITVDGPTLTVSAANNALSSDGSLTMNSGTLNLTAAGDGMKSEPSEGDTASAGIITINGGMLTITSGGDGIVATGNVTITDGILAIQSGDDALHTEGTLNIGIKDSTAGPSIDIPSSKEGFEGAVINLYSGSADLIASDDGMNAANGDLENSHDFSLNIFGGTWKINSSGDGLDANGDVNLHGGVVEVFGATNNGNSALDYDGTCFYEGGTILAVGMSGMAMAPSDGTYVAFGTVHMMGGPGHGDQGQMSPRDQAQAKPNSQGQTPQNGQPSMPPRGYGQVPTDAQTGATIKVPQDRPVPNTNTDTSAYTISADDSIVIQDAAGNTLYTTTGLKTANSVIFASERIQSGSTYTLLVNGSTVATATAVTGTDTAAGSVSTSGGDLFPAILFPMAACMFLVFMLILKRKSK